MLRAAFQKGIIAGGVATLIATALELMGYVILDTSTTVHMITKLIFPNQSLNFLQLFYGLIVHLTAGCLIGISVVLVFRYLSYELPHILAVMAGLFFWIVHTLVIPNLAAKNVYLFRTELEVTVDLISHLLYGTLTVFFLKPSERPLKD